MEDAEGSPLGPDLQEKLQAIPLTELAEAAQAQQMPSVSALEAAGTVVADMQQRERETHRFQTLRDIFWKFHELLGENPNVANRKVTVLPNYGNEQVWLSLNMKGDAVALHHFTRDAASNTSKYETIQPLDAGVTKIKVNNIHGNTERILTEDGDVDLLVHVYSVVLKAESKFIQPSRRQSKLRKSFQKFLEFNW